MKPRTPLEALLAGLYDAQATAFGDRRRWVRLSLGQRGAVRAMWQVIAVEGVRDRTEVAEVGGTHLRKWSRTWSGEDWLEFHRPRMEKFAGRLLLAYAERQEAAA